MNTTTRRTSRELPRTSAVRAERDAVRAAITGRPVA